MKKLFVFLKVCALAIFVVPVMYVFAACTPATTEEDCDCDYEDCCIECCDDDCDADCVS